MWNSVKTLFLMTMLALLLIGIGFYFMGTAGAIGAFVIAFALNFGAYFYSDSLILSRYDAQEVTEGDAPELYRIVEQLADQADLPMPAVYLIPEQSPNAFATGRNPANAAVAVTEGLLNLLNREELKAVLAHELGHVYNRDTLINVVAATFASAIGMLAMVARFSAFFGGGRDRGNMFAMLAIAILSPIMAMIIQAAISRSREFKADHTGGEFSQNPRALASALRKIEQGVKQQPMERASQETAHLFIANPLSMEGVQSLFSTHPSTEERIERLEEQAQALESS